MLRFILALCLAMLIGGSSYGQYRSNVRYGHNYSYSYGYRYQPLVGWKWYPASTYNNRYYKAGYYAQIDNRWHLQGHGPYDGEPAPAVPTPMGKGGLTEEETAKLRELLKKLKE